jgi:hypothetical protein
MRLRNLIAAAVAACLAALMITGIVSPLPAPSQAAQAKASPAYLSVRRYEGIPDAAKAAQVVNDTWIPIISRIPGFISYYWVDAGDGVMVSTSLFETREGAEDSNRQVKQWRLNTPAAGAALPNPPVVTAGQVVGSRHSKLR